jgi:hypothetical protein
MHYVNLVETVHGFVAVYFQGLFIAGSALVLQPTIIHVSLGHPRPLMHRRMRRRILNIIRIFHAFFCSNGYSL